jgi:predicted Zn-dependent peptidase
MKGSRGQGFKGSREMIKRRPVIFVLIAFIFFSTFAAAQEKNLLKPPSALIFRPLQFSPPEPERHEFKNGMVVYLLEDHEIPVVNVTARIRNGSIYEPGEKAGLAELTGLVMRTGGTKSMSGDAIDEELEYMAGSVGVSIGSQSGSASLTTLTKDLDQGLRIYADIMRHPIFAQEKFDLAKKQKEEELRRENDDPQNIAFREYRKILYRDNPRGSFPTMPSVQKIKREDLIAFHQKYFYPDRVILGVSGDFSPKEMLDRLEKLFGDWEKANEPIPQVPVPTSQQKSVNLVSKDVPQSIIVLGHLAVPKNNPDFYPFTLLNYILGGGGFNSRLTSDIRSNRGLAYSVGSFYRGDIDYGAFGAYCFTKSSTTHEVVDLILKNLQDIRGKGVTGEELQWAKDSIINSFIFSFTSSHQIVVETMDLEYDHLPADYLKTYQEKISKVTRDDIEKVAKSSLHPESAIFLVVGNEGAFDKPLTDLGKVNRIELPK